ncbi:glycosyltransferase family 4 protein [Methanofollis fontis]|nr:glycosyltransferase family 4 protein [Methanofollis fontis]
MEVENRHLISAGIWKEMKTFSPDIIHYITAPTQSSFFVLKTAQKICGGDVKTVISALHPRSHDLFSNSFTRRYVQSLKPDLILTQCREIENNFTSAGCKTSRLPNGVDTLRFTPRNQEDRIRMRESLGIDEEKYVILHVGHITRARGIGILRDLQNADRDHQVVIVGSSYFKPDHTLWNDLKQSGCLILNTYFRHIEEIYGLADCYVFPTPPANSIFMPLSVLEAMSCNIPVVSTPFQGLTDHFSEGEGLRFFTEPVDLIRHIEEYQQGVRDTGIREKVLPIDWSVIGRRLEGEYHKVAQEC